MEIVIIAITACLASLLTFFSGFGLGTLLTPVMFLFFPPEIAIALTGVVHFLNNCFKILLTKKYIQWKIGLPFAASALIGSFLGARALLNLSEYNKVLYTYLFMEKSFDITAIKLLIAFLMMVFVLLEMLPAFQKISFGKKSLLPGGFISGFFGGLSGMQGALRTMFLIKTGMGKEAFIATGIMIACVVDITRLGVYFGRMEAFRWENHIFTMSVAVLSAFIGAYAGSRLFKKITFQWLQTLVGIMLFLIAIALGAGWI